MRRSAIGLAAIGVMHAALPFAAMADSTSGRWVFRTDIAEKGCTITGTMVIKPSGEDTSVRACEFVSTEVCGFDDPQPTVMEQSCRVIRQGDFLLIRSEVTGSKTDGVTVDAYLPDHFTLTEVSASEMTGGWYDRLYRDAVTFWRPEPVPVS